MVSDKYLQSVDLSPDALALPEVDGFLHDREWCEKDENSFWGHSAEVDDGPSQIWQVTGVLSNTNRWSSTFVTAINNRTKYFENARYVQKTQIFQDF